MSDLSINGQKVGFKEVRRFTLDLSDQEQNALESKVQQIATSQGITAPEDLIALRGQAFIQELAAKAERMGLMKDGYDSVTFIDENGEVMIGYGDKLNLDGLYKTRQGEVPTMTMDGKPVQLLFADDEVNGFTDGIANQWGAGSDGRGATVTFAKLGAISFTAGTVMQGISLGTIADALGPASTANRKFMSKVIGAPVDIARKAVNSSVVERALASRAGKVVSNGTYKLGKGLSRFGLGALVVAGAVAVGNTVYGGYRGIAESNSQKMDVLNQMSQPIK